MIKTPVHSLSEEFFNVKSPLLGFEEFNPNNFNYLSKIKLFNQNEVYTAYILSARKIPLESINDQIGFDSYMINFYQALEHAIEKGHIDNEAKSEQLIRYGIPTFDEFGIINKVEIEIIFKPKQ